MANSKGPSVSVGTINERRLRPVYDLLDNGNNKSAVHEADKVLKKQKDLSAAKVLKTIALHRLGRVDDAYALSQEVAITGPSDENSLQGLTLYYREIQRPDLIPPIYEVALSKCPNNEEYMTHLFMAYVRLGKPKEMHKVAINLFKQHPKNPYLFWGVMAIVMQANENEQLGKSMFLPLAEKMIEKQIEKGKLEAEAETRLYLMVLNALGKYDKVMEVLETEVKKHFMINQDSIQEMITDTNKKMGRWDRVNSSAIELLRKNPDVWNYTLDYLDSLERLIEMELTTVEPKRNSSKLAHYTWDAAIELLVDLKNIEIQDNSDRPRRGPHLAVLELAYRMSNIGLLSDDSSLGNKVDLVIEYILQKVTDIVTLAFPKSTEQSNGEVDDKTKEKEIQSHLSYVKLQRYLGYHELLSREERLDLVGDFLRRHETGLQYSEYRPTSDLRTVDDYCLLAANILYDLYLEEGDVECAWRSLYVLELARQKSETNYRFKFMLIRLYCEFGIFMPCAPIYDSLDVKHVQQDTLGYLVCNSVLSLGHYQLASQAFEAVRAFFLSNEKDSLEFLISCFKNGSFHKVPEFLSFRKRVKNSMQSAMTLMEHTYMDMVTQADIEMSLTELVKLSCLPSEMTQFNQLTDNRDFSLLFDWTSDRREIHIKTSFDLEKMWLQFREMQVRTFVKLLKNTNNNLPDLVESFENIVRKFTDLDTQRAIKMSFPLHGPPRPKIEAAVNAGYPLVMLNLIRLLPFKVFTPGNALM